MLAVRAQFIYLLSPSFVACFHLATSRLHLLRSYGRPYGLKCVLSFSQIYVVREKKTSANERAIHISIAAAAATEIYTHCVYLMMMMEGKKKCGAKNAKLDFQSKCFFFILISSLGFPMCLLIFFASAVRYSFDSMAQKKYQYEEGEKKFVLWRIFLIYILRQIRFSWILLTQKIFSYINIFVRKKKPHLLKTNLRKQ